MKKEDKIIFTVEPDKSKDELIYSNVVHNLNLTMDEQVKFLKGKVFSLERKLRERTSYILLFAFCSLALAFGITLLCLNFYVFGITLIVATFIFVILQLILNFHNKMKELESNEFDEVEALIKVLNDKLK